MLPNIVTVGHNITSHQNIYHFYNIENCWIVDFLLLYFFSIWLRFFYLTRLFPYFSVRSLVPLWENYWNLARSSKVHSDGPGVPWKWPKRKMTKRKMTFVWRKMTSIWNLSKFSRKKGLKYYLGTFFKGNLPLWS